MLKLKRAIAGKSNIAFDAGYSGMRAAQLKTGARQWTIANLSCCDESNLNVDNESDSQILKRRLEKCIGRAEFSGNKVAVGISPPDVHFQPLEIPEAIAENDSLEGEAVIREEIKRMLPPSDSDFNTAHWVLPKTTVNAPNTLGVAMDSDKIKSTIAACRAARLDCVVIDTSATALSRFGAIIRTPSKGELWGILDIGNRETRLTLCVNETPVLTRAVGDGSARWTTSIAEELGITEKTAEIQKCEHGISVPQRHGERGSEDATADKVGSIIFGIIRASLTTIATEINRSYEYALSCYGHCQAADMILVGGGAALKNLPGYLSDALGIPARLAHEYVGNQDCRLIAELSNTEQLNQYALAIGLAIGE